MSPILRLRYFATVRNIGDRMSPLLVEDVTGLPVRLEAGKRPHILGLGSLMASARAASFVWGTGVMHPDIGVGTALPRNVLALRGKLSHHAVSRANGRLPDIPLGDPGVLVADRMRRAEVPRYRLGLTPHHLHIYDAGIQRLAREDGVVLLDPRLPPDTYFARMTECSAIAGSSLHGLIFAEALGVPNVWLELPGETGGGRFKFDDWFSLAARPQREPRRLAGGEPASTLAAEATLHEIAIDRSALRAALSERAVTAASEEAAAAFRPVADCRAAPTIAFLAPADETALQRAVASVKRLAPDAAIVVQLPAACSAPGDSTITVCRGRSLAETVEATFAGWAERQPYLVDDGSDDLTWLPPDALARLSELLDRLPQAGAVTLAPGPVDPDARPTLRTAFGMTAVADAAAGTSFALHRGPLSRAEGRTFSAFFSPMAGTTLRDGQPAASNPT